MSSLTSRSASIQLPEKDNAEAPKSLASRIQQIGDAEVNEAVLACSELVPKLQTSLSYTGERLVQHEAYTGYGNLNQLARIWLRLGWKCRSQDARLQTRLYHYEMRPAFQQFYKDTEKDIKQSRVAWFFTEVREFTLGCPCCLGVPWVVILEGGRGGGGQALCVREDLSEKYWGAAAAKKSGGSIPFSPLKTLRATPEQIREAITRGAEAE